MPGGIRKYDLNVSVETATAASSPTPSLASDLVTKDYVDTNFVGIGYGGSSVKWWNGASPSPVEDTENNLKVYKFISGGSEKLYSIIRVPSNYVAGSQLNLTVHMYSPSASNTILLQCVTTLIVPGTDAISSTTNQHTSTNTAITNDQANEATVATIDLSDGSGQINAVAVAGGNLLLVELSRGTDTDTADIRFLPQTTEFSY